MFVNSCQKKFIDALNDHDLEWAVLQGKPHSIEDAIKLALEYEAFKRDRSGLYCDVRPFSTEDQDLKPDKNGDSPQNQGVGVYQNNRSNANGRRKKRTFFVSTLVTLRVNVTRKETFRIMVQEPVIFVIHLTTLLGSARQDATIAKIMPPKGTGKVMKLVKISKETGISWVRGPWVSSTFRRVQNVKNGGNLPVNDSLFLTGNIHGLNIKFLVDTGATLSILHPEKYYGIPNRHRPPLEQYGLKLRMGDGALKSTLGCAITPWSWTGAPPKDGNS